jgi:uncharacterized protein YyaL (SSP411 family)
LQANLKPNRLINQKSPYLLEHAYNPVDWYPWSQEAFDKAKAEDKPVFVSIGYSVTGATLWRMNALATSKLPICLMMRLSA